MGTAKRKPDPALIEGLVREPGSFDFFRAVQLLEAHLVGQKRRAARWIGYDHSPSEVGLRFEAATTLAFPSRAITAIESAGEAGGAPSFGVLVSFLGLLGPAGALPTHYTEIALQRLHVKDRSLRDFVSALEGRVVAFFYRAWKKYRLPAAFGATDREHGEADPVLSAVLAMVGLLPRPRDAALGASDLAQAHHASLFSDRRRSANGLWAMLRGLLGCGVEVEQFVGQWIELDPEARSRLGQGPGPGLSARLGEQSVLGTRVWSVDSRIRVVVGPLSRRRFRDLWPGGARVGFLWRVLRAYLGPLIECDLVWALHPDAPAAVRLGGDQQLGRDCWLGWSDHALPDLRVGSPPWKPAGAWAAPLPVPA